MVPLGSRVDDLLRAPLGAATFVLAYDRGFDADSLANPAAVSALSRAALLDLNPWTGHAAARRARALATVQSVRNLVTAVATDPRNAWWSAPLHRAAQLLLLGRNEEQQDPMQLQVPTGPIDRWEAYAQRPLHGTFTSSELAVPAAEEIRSSAHAELARGCSDWNPTYPVRQTRLVVASTARIYEVDSAADWHRLVLRYGNPMTHSGSDRNLRDTAGIDNGLAPTWSSVAEDCDAVHLTFTGLLTGLYVPVTTEGVRTTLWAWEWERTCWLRSVFATATTLPDLPDAPESSYDLGVGPV